MVCTKVLQKIHLKMISFMLSRGKKKSQTVLKGLGGETMIDEVTL